MTSDARQRTERVTADLRAVVADRLRALVVFGAHADDAHAAGEAPLHTLAVIERLSANDLDGLARLAQHWERAGIATPLLIEAGEFERSFDAFPIEFGAITSRYVVAAGQDPFRDLRVDPADLRRACEVEVRGHLLHLRQGYLLTGGVPAHIAELIARSAAAFRTLLVNLALLAGEPERTPEALAAHAARITGLPASTFADVLALTTPGAQASDAARLFVPYVTGVERIAGYVDRWSAEA